MKKNNHFVGIFSTTLVVVVIATVWYFLFGYQWIPKTINYETNKVQAEKRLLDISNVDEAYDAILNRSTKEFIGYHAIDEEFLGWFSGIYGVEALESIAAYAELEDADIWYNITGSSIHVLWYNYCQETGMQNYAYEKTIVKECSSPYQTVLDFTGDYSLAEDVGTTTYFHSVDDDLTQCISENLLQEMNAADIMVVNNEFTYSNRGEPIPGKDYTFRADPKLSEKLLDMGTDVAGLANNHTYDYGEEGLLDTLDAIAEQGIPTIGAGKNLDEASEPVYFIANGRKIAIVAATQIERSIKYTKEATEDSPGVLKTLSPTKYVEVIKEAKKNSDYVICFVHWGTEHTHAYGADQHALAKAFVDAGADAIVGGHSHCLQGVDMIDGVPVYYSLGNFYFSQEKEMPDDYDTAMAQLVIEADGKIYAKILPCKFSGGVLSLLEDGGEIERILTNIRGYSTLATLDENGYIISKDIENNSGHMSE